MKTQNMNRHKKWRLEKKNKNKKKQQKKKKKKQLAEDSWKKYYEQFEIRKP